MSRGRTDRRRGTAGFTLLEALVSLALTATIIAFLALITHQWLPNWNRGFAYVQDQDQLAVGIERLASDLAAAEFIPVHRKSQLPFFAGTAHSVLLVRAASAPRTYPTLEFVRIAEADGNDEPVVVRSHAPFTLANANDRNGPRFTDPVTLLRPPYRLSFSFAGADRIWLDRWVDAQQLPRAIKMTLQDARTQRTLAASTATLVHAEVPVECITSKSLAECVKLRAQTQNQATAPADQKAPRVQ